MELHEFHMDPIGFHCIPLNSIGFQWIPVESVPVESIGGFDGFQRTALEVPRGGALADGARSGTFPKFSKI